MVNIGTAGLIGLGIGSARADWGSIMVGSLDLEDLWLAAWVKMAIAYRWFEWLDLGVLNMEC